MSFWDGIEALFAKRTDPPLRPIPGHTMGIPPRDNDFVATLTPIHGIDIDGVAIGILYRDATGTPSTRTIRCRQALRDGDLIYIHAWCLHRQDWRTFRLDRVLEVYDYRTGELLGRGPDFFSELLGGIVIADPRAEEKAAPIFRDGAKILLFIAMEDGDLHPAEMGIVVDFATARLQRLVPGLSRPDMAARLWIGNHVPTRRSALAALRAIAADDDYARDVADRMIAVMLADGTVKDSELAAAWAIVKGLERIAKKGSGSV